MSWSDPRRLVCGLGVALLAVAGSGLSAQTAPGPAKAPASRPPGRVAVIDVQRLLAESAAGRAALEELRKLRERKEAEKEAKQKELNELQERFSQGQNSLSEEVLAELRKELQEKVIAFQRLRESVDQELESARTTAFGKVEDQVMPVIAEVGRELGYDAIFNKFQSGLLFAGDDADVTDLVLARIAKREAPAPPKSPEPPRDGARAEDSGD